MIADWMYAIWIGVLNTLNTLLPKATGTTDLPGFDPSSGPLQAIINLGYYLDVNPLLFIISLFFALFIPFATVKILMLLITWLLDVVP